MGFSYRYRIVLWYCVVVLLTLLSFRLISVQVVRQLLYRDLDMSLKAEAEWVSTVVESYKARRIPDDEIRQEITARSRLSPRKEYIEIREQGGTEYYRTPNLAEVASLSTAASGPIVEPVTIDKFRGQALRLFRMTDPRYEIYVGYPLTDIEATIKKLLDSFVLLLPATLVLLVAGGMFLVGRLIRPVRELNRYAAALIEKPLNEEPQMAAVTQRDEIGVLVEQINGVVEKLRSNMRHALSFSSLASHELRTPLSVVRSELEVAMRPDISVEALREKTASTYDEVLRLSRVVDDLLSLSTMQAGTFSLKASRTNLRRMLEEFREEAEVLAREKDISIVLEPGKDVFALADVGRIRQVLFNLLDNAIKNTPAGGEIRLRCGQDSVRSVIGFSDNGKGIPPEKLTRIFDFFYRGDVSDNGLPGAGLGLALVRWIVEIHGGKVGVTSAPGSGTTFEISLPLG